VDKIPEDGDARLAFLGEWANKQQGRLDAEQQRRQYAQDTDRALAQARLRGAQGDPLRGLALIPIVITKPSDLPPDRAAAFADLMVGLRKYKWADPIVSECDEPRYIASEAIDLARRHHPGAPWLLYMEDDVILGPDFGLLPGLLRDADGRFPKMGLVSFFSVSFGEPGWSIHPMKQFGWLQCAAIRNTDHLAGFQRPRGPSYAPDAALRSFLAVEYDAFALWCPSLVQHAEVTSAFYGQSVNASERISKSYKQAYG
jgi:hypothetical protein